MNESSKPLKQAAEPREEGGFLSRWSRLKTESQQTTKEAKSSLSEQQPLEDVPSSDKKEPQAEVLTDTDMPDLETLNGESDYSGFLSPGVSEELRKLALRKLFNTDHFHIRDGLDDYDEEFTQFEKLGDIITADMRFQMEQEAKAKLKDQLDTDEQAQRPENMMEQDGQSVVIEDDEVEELIEEDDGIEAVTSAQDETNASEQQAEQWSELNNEKLV